MTSTIKVDNIQDQDGNNIINENSNTITIGASGDTVTLASGASQTGFGRTGTVDWQTGSIKTATFTAANGEGYFCNTGGGAFTMNLPAGSAGAIVSVQDYNNTFDSNSLTVDPNGSEKINGGAGPVILNTEGEGLTLVYIDATVGWRSIQDSAFADVGASFITATGGTITTSGNDKIHTFTGPGTFTVCSLAVCATNNVVSYMVVAGGGGGGQNTPFGSTGAGAGGAGGYREVKSPVTPYTASPLDGYPSAPNRITATVASFPITVGAGGAGSPCAPGFRRGTQGGTSTFSTISSAGGGGGGSGNNGSAPGIHDGGPGGSGGGTSEGGSVGSGNTPPVSPSQGNNGGLGNLGEAGGGGGGAGAVGTSTPNPSTGQPGGPGGAGVASSITASPVTRAGGGGGGGVNSPSSGGAGGGGGGGIPGGPTPGNGTANTGGGGGGGTANDCHSGGTGGSGIVVIRYKFQ
jgi:hypothetical protein